MSLHASRFFGHLTDATHQLQVLIRPVDERFDADAAVERRLRTLPIGD